jgi:hypothetical protein
VRFVHPHSSKLRVESSGENIHRAAVGVVTGIHDELIVEADLCRGGDGVAVIGLDNLLEAVIEPPVADDDAGAAGFEVGGVYWRQPVDYAGDADCVGGPPPILSVD